MDNQIDLEKENLKEEVKYLRTMNLSLINILEKQTEIRFRYFDIMNIDSLEETSDLNKPKKNKRYNKNTSSNSGLRNDDVEL